MPDPIPDKPKIDFSKLEQYSKESEWRMRNEDGVEYGPYSWEQVLQFAKEGRVLLTSEFLSLSVTKGKWVRAEKIKVVAAIIAENTPKVPSVVAPPVTAQEPVLFQAKNENGGATQNASNLELILADILKSMSNAKVGSKAFVRSTGRSWFVVIVHMIALVWLACPLLYAPYYGFGTVHWLSTGGLPGIGNGAESLIFFPAIYIKFALPGIFLSVLAEILHTVSIPRKQ
jgi:hypothetical protein